MNVRERASIIANVMDNMNSNAKRETYLDHNVKGDLGIKRDVTVTEAWGCRISLRKKKRDFAAVTSIYCSTVADGCAGMVPCFIEVRGLGVAVIGPHTSALSGDLIFASSSRPPQSSYGTKGRR